MVLRNCPKDGKDIAQQFDVKMFTLDECCLLAYCTHNDLLNFFVLA